jgi:hypothetical protein
LTLFNDPRKAQDNRIAQVGKDYDELVALNNIEVSPHVLEGSRDTHYDES